MISDYLEKEFFLSEKIYYFETENLRPEIPQRNFFEFGLCVLGAVVVHGLILLLLFYSGAALFYGIGKLPGEEVITVSLAGDSGSGLPPGEAPEAGIGDSTNLAAGPLLEDQSESDMDKTEDLSVAPTETEPPLIEELQIKPEDLAVKASRPETEPRPTKITSTLAKPRQRIENRNPAPKGVGMENKTDDRGAGQGGGGVKNGQGAGGVRGGGGQGNYGKANFSYIQKKIQRSMSYPSSAKQMGITGRVTVAFTISKNGQASNIRVIGSSGNALLDAAAVAAVNKASPFPPPPSAATINIPLVFGLK